MPVLVWRVLANIIDGRDSECYYNDRQSMRYLYIKNECLRYGRLELLGQFDIHKVS